MKNLSKLIIYIFAALGIIICISFAVYLLSTNEQTWNEKVERVIDGDTFQTSEGETIRMLCVNTPEVNETGYEEASEFLSELILDKEVRLENPQDFGFSEKDIYGRTLAFVYLDDVLINKAIVLANHSQIYDFNNTADICRKVFEME